MRWRTPVIPALLACLLLASSAGSQAPATDLEILKRVVETYQGLKRYLLQDSQPFLKAENPEFPDLIPARELLINMG